jgi:hypothetical protein
MCRSPHILADRYFFQYSRPESILQRTGEKRNACGKTAEENNSGIPCKKMIK